MFQYSTICNKIWPMCSDPFKNSFYVIVFICILTSCGESESPDPVAEFFIEVERDPRSNLAGEVSDTIEFRNTSTHATDFIWDFGDGSSSIVEVARHKYQERGIYNVQLTAISSDGRSSTMQKSLRIGGRKFRGLSINKMSNTKPNGETWDDGHPPDLLFYFGEVDNPENSVLLQFVPNFPLDDIPFGGNVDFRTKFFLTDTKWFFLIFDNDYPSEQFDENDELIFGKELNPTTVGIKNIPDGWGRLELKDGFDANGNPNSDVEMTITWDFEVE